MENVSQRVTNAMEETIARTIRKNRRTVQSEISPRILSVAMENAFEQIMSAMAALITVETAPTRTVLTADQCAVAEVDSLAEMETAYIHLISATEEMTAVTTATSIQIAALSVQKGASFHVRTENASPEVMSVMEEMTAETTLMNTTARPVNWFVSTEGIIIAPMETASLHHLCATDEMTAGTTAMRTA